MFAYRSRFLRGDLTDRRVEMLPTGPDGLQEYLGGGVRAKIDYAQTTPDTNPLGQLLGDYCALGQWSEMGIPGAEKLAELDLENL